MNSDDPKLTAYALDELDPAERAEIEQLLRDDLAARADVEEMKTFTARLSHELKAETGAPLTEAQRAEVLALGEEQLVADVVPFTAGSNASRWPRLWLPLAAAVLIVAGVAALALNHAAFLQRLANTTPAPTFVAAEMDAVVSDGRVPTAPPLSLASEVPMLLPPMTDPQAAAASTIQSMTTINQWSGTIAANGGVTSIPGQTLSGSGAFTAGGGVAEGLTARFQSIGGTSRMTKSGAGTLALDAGASKALADGTKSGSGHWSFDSYGIAPTPVTAGKATAAAKDVAAYSKRGLVLENAGGFVTAAPHGESEEPTLARNAGKAVDLGAAEKRLAEVKKEYDGLLATLPSVSVAKKARDESVPLSPAERSLQATAERIVRLETELVEAEEKVREAKGETRAGNTESYDPITDNAFLAVRENPLSTFSIDVDTASYANVRRFLNQQARPPKGAVRIEELLNYFTYDYPQPEGDTPFSATMEVATCPWAPGHRLVRVGLKGREIQEGKRPASNLVFLIDVSGSMQPENRLPLVKKCLRLLTDRLSDEDTVAIAVYAGASGTVLEPTHSKREIREALDRLGAGGSTNGASGIQLAYRLAEQSFIKGGVNRVILATDGDFNVGVTSQSDLVDLIERKAKSGVFLTVLGFGMDNLKDSTLEKLADKGNGNYAYIDTLNEGRKVLVEQMNGTLVTIAKDVKIQVEFNPAQASAYRLIGYENRLLAKEDFNDDKKDAGEIGAGHTVTALYEVVPAGKSAPGVPTVDALKYGAKSEVSHPQGAVAAELLTLKLRYKQPDGDTSKLLEFPLTDRGETWEKSSRDFRFAAAVAGFGMLLRDSPHKGSATWDSVRELAVEGRGEDRSGYRGEFLTLLDQAKALVR